MHNYIAISIYTLLIFMHVCLLYCIDAVASVRWEQNTKDSAALMEKAQGSWKDLTLDEKKSLYRHRCVDVDISSVFFFLCLKTELISGFGSVISNG